MSEGIAEKAVEALLEPLRRAGHVGVDANSLRQNQPGYDFLIDGLVRLQVKGSKTVECIDWTLSGNPDAADMGFDVLVVVDIGVTLDANVGRLAKYRLPQQEFVTFYIVPRSVVAEWLRIPRYPTKVGAYFYVYRRPLREGSKEALRQTPEILQWKNRFDIIKQLVRPG